MKLGIRVSCLMYWCRRVVGARCRWQLKLSSSRVLHRRHPSDVNSVSSCGSKSHPWHLEAAAGQRINISLLDFTVMSTSATDRPRDRITCRQYGYVLEKWNKRNVSVCGGGGAELRQSHVYSSDSNNLEIVRTTNVQTSDNEQSFLIKVEGTSTHNVTSLCFSMFNSHCYNIFCRN